MKPGVMRLLDSLRQQHLRPGQRQHQHQIRSPTPRQRRASRARLQPPSATAALPTRMTTVIIGASGAKTWVGPTGEPSMSISDAVVIESIGSLATIGTGDVTNDSFPVLRVLLAVSSRAAVVERTSSFAHPATRATNTIGTSRTRLRT